MDLRRRRRQHGQAAGGVEAADADGDAGPAQRARDIEGPRILVRLHADEGDEAAGAGALEVANDLGDLDPVVGLVGDGDADLDVVAEDASLRAIGRQPVEHGQGVGGDVGARPLDHIAVVIIVGGFDEQELKHSTALVAGSRPRDWHRLFPEDAGRLAATAMRSRCHIG